MPPHHEEHQMAARLMILWTLVATSAVGGSVFKVSWTGPDHPRDFVTFVKTGTPDKQYGPYAYTSKGETLTLTAPDEPGKYEVRYLTAQTYATLGAAPIEITAISATIKGPAEAVAGSTFATQWQAPTTTTTT
jgi:Ca-activated chloride channel family protein